MTANELKNANHNKFWYLASMPNSYSLIIHLGMSGRLKILKGNTSIEKHDHISLKFGSNSSLLFNDPLKTLTPKSFANNSIESSDL